MANEPTTEEVTAALSDELKNLTTYLDHSLDELANAATKITAGLSTLADLAGRIRRQVEDPPAKRHTLDIHEGTHGSEADFIDPDPEPS